MPAMPRQHRHLPPPAKKTGGRRPKEIEEMSFGQMSEEERDKRDKRRQRNKEAAARCRQRRLDMMSSLQDEVDQLRRENQDREETIHVLRQQKAELEQLLRNNGCKIPHDLLVDPSAIVVTTASHFSAPISAVPRKRPMTVMTTTAANVVDPPRKLIKTEPTLAQLGEERSDTENLRRPTSLMIESSTSNNPAGVPISTPSNGLTPGDMGFGFQLNQPTGLTPIATNVVTLGFPVTSLATPLDSNSESVLKTL